LKRLFSAWLFVPLVILLIAILFYLRPWGLPRYHGQSGKRAGERCVNPKDGAVMVWVPAGEFLMGSSDQQINVLINKNRIGKPEYLHSEKPQHKIYLYGFWIYKNLVTVAQYRKFCTAKELQMPEQFPGQEAGNFPIKAINWFDALEYSKWAGAMLPTEAQWEKAARGTDGRIYPWGNSWDANKCVRTNITSVNGRTVSASSADFTPIGSFPEGASPYGCMDMVGAVAQWCNDWYGEKYYQHSPAQNPQGPVLGEKRVLRGKNIFESLKPASFRCISRMGYEPEEEYLEIGFRCVIIPPK